MALLESLMIIDEFDALRLVGGTALALQIGHRNSVDIDLFGKHSMDELTLANVLARFDHIKKLGGSQSIQIYLVNGIKVDFVNYPYHWVKPPLVLSGLRMAALEDIAAMKIAAITQRGSKKDFIDLFFLLHKFSMPEVMAFYREKISDGNEWLALRSMTYFDDADNQPNPTMFQKYSWEKIKSYVSREAKDYGGY
ncbi:nucleotidyl transferase AbiEii/AbiGii toxin family protein [Pleomorphovibrio marinus]|uniref:nucleotidyl transferase AbiEii/AbiGii toxin family protein n=1 Tax=Pleomorphovibrio marinus TaxID=2164132 RepID=UPI0018E557BC|nr:nucleotidyl transferase AbiEii/AbiGii toxin family protein [Pleomorphovibrio marinus]